MGWEPPAARSHLRAGLGRAREGRVACFGAEQRLGLVRAPRHRREMRLGAIPHSLSRVPAMTILPFSMERAFAVIGPPAVGKTTLTTRLAENPGRTVFRLREHV